MNNKGTDKIILQEFRKKFPEQQLNPYYAKQVEKWLLSKVREAREEGRKKALLEITRIKNDIDKIILKEGR